MQLETQQPTRQAEHDLVFQVRAAQADPAAADTLIGQYMPFIRSETYKFTHAPIEAGHEDELSIATLAFYEAALSYQKGRGAVLPYAAAAIRNRLIDHYPAGRRPRGRGPPGAPAGGGGRPPAETPPRTPGDIGAYDLRAATRAEIEAFGRQLAGYGIGFSDVADNCPRQERTLAACRAVLDCARANPILLEKLVRTGRLPMQDLALGSGVDKKTIERHRKYLVAILLAFTNGYEIIRGHLCQLTPKGGKQG